MNRSECGTITSVELSDAERLCGRENYDFYCFLIWPFIEGSWLGAVSLMGLTPPLDSRQDVWIDMRKAQDSAQLLGKTLYHQGDLSYFEAVNKETLKNAYQRFQEEGIILVTKGKEKDSKVAPSVRLAPAWTPTRDKRTGKVMDCGRLWDFTERIAKSRREGKNRRDGATVSTRVLALSDTLGRKLFNEATTETGEDVTVSPKRLKTKPIDTRAQL